MLVRVRARIEAFLDSGNEAWDPTFLLVPSAIAVAVSLAVFMPGSRIQAARRRLASKRPYKPTWPPADAIAEIARLAGTHLDTDVVAAFVELCDRNILRDPDGASADAGIVLPASEAA